MLWQTSSMGYVAACCACNSNTLHLHRGRLVSAAGMRLRCCYLVSPMDGPVMLALKRAELSITLNGLLMAGLPV